MAGLEGRTLLKPDIMGDIERMARIVLAHQSAAKALTGGVSEVSILWTEENTGIPMKARVDYLKTKAIVDVKSFNNPLGKPIDAAVASAVANCRYDVQAVIYDEAVKQAKAMLRTLKTAAIHHVSGPMPSNEWIVATASCPQHTFVFVFIEQGPVTNVRVREFTRSETYGGLGGSTNMHWLSGEAGFYEGLKRYSNCMKQFGPDKPWIEDQPMRPFSEQDFPLYMFNQP